MRSRSDYGRYKTCQVYTYRKACWKTKKTRECPGATFVVEVDGSMEMEVLSTSMQAHERFHASTWKLTWKLPPLLLMEASTAFRKKLPLTSMETVSSMEVALSGGFHGTFRGNPTYYGSYHLLPWQYNSSLIICFHGSFHLLPPWRK